MSMKDKRVLVTGASGFIASHLVRRLVSEGAQVGAMVRYAAAIACPRLADVWDRIDPLEADVRNRGALALVKAAFQPEIVFHLAAYNHVGRSWNQVEECFDVNARGTANMIDLFAGSSCAAFVYVSTSEVYGAQTSVPWAETTHTPTPQSPYAVTKYAGEQYAAMWQRETDDPKSECLRIVRPFNAYGPGQSTHAVIPEIITACVNDADVMTSPGQQTREFNYVGDVVDGLIRAAKASPFTGPVNICCGEETRLEDLIRLVKDLTQSESSLNIGALPYRPNEIMRMAGDNARARALLGWEPCVSLRDGLAQTVEWFADRARSGVQAT